MTEEWAMSSFFQIPFETPEERPSDLLWPPTGAPTPMFHPPQGAPGEPEPLDRRRLRSGMVAVGVAGLLVLGSYALAEAQTSFQCDPQNPYCYPGYEGYPGYGGYPGYTGFRGGGHGDSARFGGYSAHFEGSTGFGGGFGGFGGSGAGHGGGGGG
jgi:hypothetical protein